MMRLTGTPQYINNTNYTDKDMSEESTLHVFLFLHWDGVPLEDLVTSEYAGQFRNDAYEKKRGQLAPGVYTRSPLEWGRHKTWL